MTSMLKSSFIKYTFTSLVDTNKQQKFLFSAKKFSTCQCLAKRPRVYPVTHQVLNDHNANYFTSYPNLSKEELEEPPPRVSDEVKALLQASRASYEGRKFIPGEIKMWQFRRKRREMIKEGHYFPEKPMRDRMLDPMPKVKKIVIEKEERKKRIEENMKMMPIWIANYREEQRLKRLKIKENKEKDSVVMMQLKKLGIHKKDPRAQELLQKKTVSDEGREKKKKKFIAKKVKQE